MLAVLNEEVLSILIKTLGGKMQEDKAGNAFLVTFGKTLLNFWLSFFIQFQYLWIQNDKMCTAETEVRPAE